MRAVGGKHGKYVLLERSGQAVDPGEDRAVDDVDAGIDRAGRALAGRDERANPIAVHDRPGRTGRRRHRRAAPCERGWNCARATRSRMLKSKNESPLSSRKRSCSRSAAWTSAPAVPSGACSSETMRRARPLTCAGVAGLNALGLVARQQQDFLENVVARDFIDQHIEKRPAADRQHRLRRGLGPLAEPRAKPADQDDGLPQHWACSTQLHGWSPCSLFIWRCNLKGFGDAVIGYSLQQQRSVIQRVPISRFLSLWC